ncbi:MAG: ABC transporter permease [Oscillospiraceae bacterium]|nr:ABC transporter permease [Oscillospiraceae bacterium]MCI1990459.1 ABC transporter permease [Oscillospiraceae bacterium]MCI2035797.1 ABC transporter permease [Oscillospiraceae bacterium]
MNMYRHEVRSLVKSTAIWIAGLAALAALYFAVYPGMMKDAENFRKLLEGYSPAVRAVLGIHLDFLTTLVGFYSMAFPFVSLCGAIQAANLGLSALSRESRERTADFLLVKPVSRSAIVSAKLLAALTAILATNAAYDAFTFFMANLVKTQDFDRKIFLMINLSLLFIQLIFFAVGMVVSVFFQRMKNVLPLSLGMVFGLYAVGALLAQKSDDPARYLSPFRYFDFIWIIRNGTYETSYLITGAVVAAVSIAASYLVYNRKDIHAVP